MRVEVTSNVNVAKHISTVKSEKFWKFAANEWFKLITPYVPMDTGILSTTVDMKPEKNSKGKKKRLANKTIQSIAEGSGNIKGGMGFGEIEYTSPYAHKMYCGNFNFRKDRHQLASSQWDKAAEPTQKPKLLRSMQDYIDSGRLF